MKHLKIIIITVIFIGAPTYLYNQEELELNHEISPALETYQEQDFSSESYQDDQYVDQENNNLTHNIIEFTTDNDDYPHGEYWVGIKPFVLSSDKEPIYISSAYIGDKSYSQILESKVFLSDDEHDLFYLGYFVEPEQTEVIYLYGIDDEEFGAYDEDEWQEYDENYFYDEEQ